MNIIDKEKVRALLHDAFNYTTYDKYSHDNYVEFRRKLPSFMPEDLQEILPRVLEELIDTHTGNPIITENAEFVLMMLDVLVTVSKETEQEHAEIWGHESVEKDRVSDEYLRKLKSHDFGQFNLQQSESIYNWLCLAASWQDFRNWQEILNGAINYWKSKITS